jgi:hypothetical protein
MPEQYQGYTTDMQQAINMLNANPPEGTFYMFILDQADDPAEMGLMPFFQSYGFIFLNACENSDELVKTIAHELGHGAFGLEHEFFLYPSISEGDPNLMTWHPTDGSLRKYQWDWIQNPFCMIDGNCGQGINEAMMVRRPNYFGQRIIEPIDRVGWIHEFAIPILNENGHTVAFITPEEDVFIWIKEGVYWEGYFQNGERNNKNSYIEWVDDKYMRESNPISWGIYLAADDLGGFAIALIDNPIETTENLAKGIWKIVTFNFDFEKTWEIIITADRTDAAYVVATLALGYLAGPKGKGFISTVDVPKFQEVLLEYLPKTRPARLTWPQLFQLFQKAKQFELAITNHLKNSLFKIADGYHVIRQVYIKVDGVISIADDIIYNSNTGKFFLNETKYGISNTLRKNQQIIENAVKAGKRLEIRTAEDFRVNGRVIFSQSDKITISKIIRSHSIDGTITSNTVKTIWP